ncbi:MAG TPA: vitamin B12-dependent ribonucleotide reductase [Candidatus Saccharimonadales bacterium]|nr:vitamin B12-dependent ribonucleotide reductase [Candidatus Saccharimonadales bacterium]
MMEPARPLRSGRWADPAMRVLRERYLVRHADGTQETPEQMCWRVAAAIAGGEVRYGRTPEQALETAHRFYDVIVDRRFVPNSPTLMNAGKDNCLQYSACYVLPVEDSLEGIFDAIKRAALIHQSGGGTGFSFSRLRSKNSVVRSTGGRASGPVSFLRVFNAATEAVKQGGARRGANMGILQVDHPDILEFIECKLDGGITNFNISVAATDRFMDALATGQDYELVEPHSQQVVGRLGARQVFRKIVEAAWRTGDPGLVFIDRVNAGAANPTPELGRVEATNPCGEQPLLPNEACNLGSLNLAEFVAQGAQGPALDWSALEEGVRLAVRFLDDVIEMNPYPLPEIDRTVKENRRIGLGVMGVADLFLSLGIPYDSQPALQLADRIMAFIQQVGHEASEQLALERGPFPNWTRSIYRHGRPLRNATVTTIAPTGTISILAGCSSGIEPAFALAFSHIVGERHLTFVNPHLERVARERGFHTPELMERIARQGTLQGITEVPAEVRRVFVTAHEVEPEWHVRMQATFQKHTDNGVSKTINLPHEATPDDIARAYQLAWDTGCLGITVFRDGCKGQQVLHVGTEPDHQAVAGASEREAAVTALAPGAGLAGHLKPRPPVAYGATYRTRTPLGTAFLTVNRNGSQEPLEVFVNVGKAGTETQAVAEALGRLISLALRLPSPMTPSERMKEIVDQMVGIGGGHALGFGPDRVRSLPDAVARVLGTHLGLTHTRPLPESQPLEAEVAAPAAPTATLEEDRHPGDLCPSCGQASFVYEEGCGKCHFCGHSEC